MKEFDTADYTLETVVGASGFTLGQLLKMYREAPNKGEQLRAIADLTTLSTEQVKALLLANGISPKELPRARKKDGPKPGVDVQKEFGEVLAEGPCRIQSEVYDALDRLKQAIDELVRVFEKQTKIISEATAAKEKLAKVRELLKREGGHDE